MLRDWFLRRIFRRISCEGRSRKMRKSLPLWKCDHCGNAAVWTMINGYPHYHCEAECEGFMNTSLDMGDGFEYVDRPGSVSAVDRDRDFHA